MNYTHTCANCEAEIEGDFTPERAAPFCQDHDSPAFSDPGEGANWDGPDECPECGEKIDKDKLFEAASEYFSNNNGPDEDRHND